MSHDVLVYFSDGTTPDYGSLNAKGDYHAEKKGDTFSLEGAQTLYNTLPSSAYTKHDFYTNKGGSVSVNSGDNAV